MQFFQDTLPLLQEAKRIMIFTGAGMSTASGIPDFRSKKGIYQFAPETILSRNFFFQHPEEFYDFFFETLYHPEAKPNEAHRILAEWEKQGKYIEIVTQNIDGLHLDAGNQDVKEFHGTIRNFTCTNAKCTKTYSIEEVEERRNTNLKTFYICDCESHTRNYIKPDVVLFDEAGKWFSGNNMHKIRENMYKADVLMVLGSSLQVYPFRTFIDNKPSIKPLIIINRDAIFQESLANTYTLHADIVATLESFHENM